MKSYWKESVKETNYPSLSKEKETEVCVIGAGIAGIATAYELVKQGKKVVLMDKGRCTMGVTANTTAKITSQHGLFYKYLIDTFGKEDAKKYLQANEEAIKTVKQIIDENNIECDFEYQDAYVYTNDEQEIHKIKDEVESVNKLGLKAEYCTETPLPFEVLSAIKFPNQAQFHVRKYLVSLLKVLENKGVLIYENSKVIDVQKDDKDYKVITEQGSVTAKYVVLTTHYPIINFPGYHFLKMYQDRSYVVAIETKEKLFEGMYISSETPGMSFRTIKDGDKRILVIGGSGHKTGENSTDLDECYIQLEKYIQKIYPDAKVKYKWSTQDCVSLDKVPYIGEFSKIMPNVYMATGFKKWGMTTAHVAAKIITDKILGKENQYEKLFEATRFHPLKNYKEFGNMLKQTAYSLVINKVKIPKEKFDEIIEGTGGVVEYNGEKVGIYKDENGKIYAVKPYCTHLGCELSWNNLEKTWDCPCHGSRFTYEGKNINEPAVEGLPVLESPDVE